MISTLFPIVAFVLVFVVSQRSLAFGVLGVISVGYFSGIVRANFQSVATTFFFDAGVAGLYFSVFFGHLQMVKKALLSSSGQLCLLLFAWPTFLTMVPINNFWIQMIALRSTIWLLPILVISANFKRKDMFVLARGFAVLNYITLIVGIYIYINGVQSLYPQNEVTKIIYQSQDVKTGNAEDVRHRIPSTFLSAHAYGNTMILTLPLLLGCAVHRNRSLIERWILSGGVVAALVGLLFCAARQPLWVMGMVLILTWIQTRFSPKVGILVGAIAAVGVYVSLTDERFQRGYTITSREGDKMFTFNRIYGSLNEEILETFLKYPFGAGMGSSVGTSIPYFLANVPIEQVGHENEYSRIQVDQGWIGLGLWLFFLFWIHSPRPRARDQDLSFILFLLHSTTALFWATAFIGTGILTSIPAAAILLASMGILVGQRDGERLRIKQARRLKAWFQKYGSTRFENLSTPNAAVEKVVRTT